MLVAGIIKKGWGKNKWGIIKICMHQKRQKTFTRIIEIA